MTTGWYNKIKYDELLKTSDVNWKDVRKGLGWGAALGTIPLAVSLMNPPKANPNATPKSPTTIVQNQPKPQPQQKTLVPLQLKEPAKNINDQKDLVKNIQSSSPSLQEMADFITNWEGNRLETYYDTKSIPTIGIGFNLKKGGAKERIESLGLSYSKIINKEQSITQEQSVKLFNEDYKTALSDAQRWIPNLSQQPKEVQMICIDMAFNMGLKTIMTFNTTSNLIQNHKYNEAASNLEKTAWYKQVGRRSKNHVAMLRQIAKNQNQK